MAQPDSSVEQVMATCAEHIAVATALRTMARQIVEAATLIRESLLAGGQLLVAGNGGSASDAQHMAAEFTGRFVRERPPLRALVLHGNPSALTAVANDYGYEWAFARELTAHAPAGDVLVAISTSGNSPNILRAATAARQLGVHVVALTGQSGGQLRDACDICLSVPSTTTARVQEMHILIVHLITEFVDERVP